MIDSFEPYFFILGDKKGTLDFIADTNQGDFYSWNEIQIENNIPKIVRVNFCICINSNHLLN